MAMLGPDERDLHVAIPLGLPPDERREGVQT
jgi:hypothetical protein